MRILHECEVPFVFGGVAKAKGGGSHFWSDLWGDVEQVWDDISGGGGGGNAACNALGNSMGALSHTPGLDDANGAILSHAGGMCNHAASLVQRGLNRQKHAIACETRGDASNCTLPKK